jgi:hypothetical protein
VQSEWLQSVISEGNAPVVTDFRPNDEGHLPCPACGTAAPLDAEGACTDCGLVLA